MAPSKTQPTPGAVTSIVQYLLRMRTMLQWENELDALVEFMRCHHVRSFLEVGAATGCLSIFLRDTLKLEKIAACDLWFSPLLKAQRIEFFRGDHHDPAYLEWRARLGHFDMVFIDADHESGFRRDYEIELAFPHTFIGFHDVMNTAYPNLMKFWDTEVEGEKHLFVNTVTSQTFGVPPIQFPFATWPTFDAYVAEFGHACGIGVVRPKPARP
jgi:hypothetical protein